MNCQSLCNKKDRFLNLVDSTKPDIIIATETWLTSSIQSSEYFGAQYEVHRRDRHDGRQGGGVLIAVNSNYTSCREEVLESSPSETIWVKISSPNCKSIYVAACYRPEHSDTATLDALDSSLEKICGKDNNIILLGGDFNLPGWDWKNSRLKPRTQYAALHQRFVDTLHDHGLTQIIQDPTRGNNTLDLIITNRPRQINRTEIIPGISDHHAVYTELEAKPCRRKQNPRDVSLYNKADWNSLKQHASSIADHIRAEEPNASVDQLWSCGRPSSRCSPKAPPSISLIDVLKVRTRAPGSLTASGARSRNATEHLRLARRRAKDRPRRNSFASNKKSSGRFDRPIGNTSRKLSPQASMIPLCLPE